MAGRLPLLDVVEVPLAGARGLVAAESVVAAEAVPPFANSAVDGFAVRSVDVAVVPVELAVVATIPAGSAAEVVVGAGEAARIMTGAPVPEGADAIVMVEDTVMVGDTAMVDTATVGDTAMVGDTAPDRGKGTQRVRILAAAVGGAHVRPVGDDLPAGAVAVAEGTVLGAAHLGLLATVGRRWVRARRRPRVGVISTGDELVDDGSPLQPGQIRDSNRVMLLALCAEAGFDGVDLGLVRDDEAAIESALLSAAAGCDAVVTSGGVSMGDYDYVKAVLDRIGDMRWMQVAIKPAKPFAFGTIGAVPVFGLPGNPVSSLVSFELFARPAIRAMAGHPHPERRRLPAVAGADLRRRPDGKVHFVRVTLGSGGDSALTAEPAGSQGSHQLAASAGADGLAVLPDGDGIPAGAPVTVIPLG